MDQHMAAIVELRERVRAHDEDIARHDQHLLKLDETVAELRTAIATVATKDDIHALREDVNKTFNRQLSDAQSSIPGKIAMWFGAGMFLIALIGLVVNLMHGHG